MLCHVFADGLLLDIRVERCGAAQILEHLLTFIAAFLLVYQIIFLCFFLNRRGRRNLRRYLLQGKLTLPRVALTGLLLSLELLLTLDLHLLPSYLPQGHLRAAHLLEHLYRLSRRLLAGALPLDDRHAFPWMLQLSPERGLARPQLVQERIQLRNLPDGVLLVFYQD